MSFELVGSEIQHKIGIIVVPVIIHSAPQAFLPYPFWTFTNRGVGTDRMRTKSIHEIMHDGTLAAFVTTILVHE